jgi:YesN/AraC family two-component response regulator
MLKLLIVDDNDFERKSLSNFINWDVIGIHLVDTAFNGQDALEKIKIHRPKIVISDVKMPVMDGIEMAKAVMAFYPETKFIFSSAHDDVGLLKEALEIRAFNYIIKPINPDELINTVKKVVSVIIDEKLANMENNSIIKQYRDNLTFLQGRFLTNVILKERNNEEINELINQANNLRLRITGGYRLVLLDMDYDREDVFGMSRKNDVVMDELRSTCEGEKVIFLELEKNRIAALLYHLVGKNDAAEKIINRMLDKINTVKDDFSFKYTLGVSAPADSLTELHHLFKQCNEAVDKKIEWGYNQTIYYEKAENGISESKALSKDNIKSLISNVVDKVFAGEDFSGELENIMSVISFMPGSKLDNTKSIFISLLNSLSKRMDMNDESLKKAAGDEIDALNHIIGARIIPDIIQYVTEVLEAVSTYHVGKRTGKEDHIVEEILEILNKEYNQPVTLNYLSDRVYLTPNYLRILFKNKTGTSIQDYLTNLRINRAKDLLKQRNYKIHEIGEMVGYINSNYFNIVFKNYSHVTPGEYRSRYLPGELNKD